MLSSIILKACSTFGLHNVDLILKIIMFFSMSPNQLLLLNNHLSRAIPAGVMYDEVEVEGLIDDDHDDAAEIAANQVFINAVTNKQH